VDEIIGDARRVVICGLGNEKRGDYGFGAYLAEALLLINKNPNVLTLNCREVPESQAGVIVRFYPELVVIATPLENAGEPGKPIFAEVPEVLGLVPASFRVQLEVTLRHLSEILPSTRFVVLGCRPGSEGMVTEETRNCVRALALELDRVLGLSQYTPSQGK
jgi:hydrogenase 3 maturation protease